jgi:hypothetical protein
MSRRASTAAHTLRMAQSLLAACLWTAAMPVLTKRLSLQRLLALLTVEPCRDLPDEDDVRLVVRSTDWLLRRPPFARGACLQRSLVLYRALRDMGLPVSIVFGVRRNGEGLGGHAWLSQTVWPGLSLGEASDCFTVMYTYPWPAPAESV